MTPAVIVTGKKQSLRESFDATRAHANEQAFEIFFRPQQEICLQSLLILHMQMPVKEHGPRSVNAHSVICAFVFLTNRDSPTSSCILARIRPVKIAPWSHSHTTSRQTPTSRPRVYVVLAEPIHRRTFSHQCIIFSEAATSSPYLEDRLPHICLLDSRTLTLFNAFVLPLGYLVHQAGP